MNASPYTRSCATAGCSAPVVRAGYCAAHGRQMDQTRGLSSDRHHKALYNSARWRRLRRDLLTTRLWCECSDCKRTPYPLLAAVVHHVHPHGGDPAKFYDVANLQPLAKRCHDRVTGRGRAGVRISTARHTPRPGWRAARETVGFIKGGC